jgi:hypothetical protein
LRVAAVSAERPSTLEKAQIPSRRNADRQIKKKTDASSPLDLATMTVIDLLPLPPPATAARPPVRTLAPQAFFFREDEAGGDSEVLE